MIPIQPFNHTISTATLFPQLIQLYDTPMWEQPTALSGYLQQLTIVSVNFKAPTIADVAYPNEPGLSSLSAIENPWL